MIVVTGGAGFIGSNLVKGLNEKGIDDIVIVDNLRSAEKIKNLGVLRFADYADKNRYFEQLASGATANSPVEAVFHIGACSDTMESDGAYMMDNNFEYSKLLLAYCQKKNIPFIYASSASVYGDGRQGFREETACEKALNVYAFSKLMFDNYVRRILPHAGSQIVGLRYFNVFGPREQHKGRMASIVYQLYNQLHATGVARLFCGTDGYPDGGQRRDFIYEKDVVRMNLFFWNHPAKSGIYNCGTGTAHSFNDVANSLIRCMGKGRIEYVEFPSALAGKYQSFTQADLTHLNQAGWPGQFMPLDDAIADYCGHLEKEVLQ